MWDLMHCQHSAAVISGVQAVFIRRVGTVNAAAHAASRIGIPGAGPLLPPEAGAQGRLRINAPPAGSRYRKQGKNGRSLPHLGCQTTQQQSSRGFCF